MLKSKIVMEFDSIEAYHQFLALVTKGAHMAPQTPGPEVPAEVPAEVGHTEDAGRPLDGSTEVAPVTPETDLASDNVQPVEAEVETEDEA